MEFLSSIDKVSIALSREVCRKQTRRLEQNNRVYSGAFELFLPFSFPTNFPYTQ